MQHGGGSRGTGCPASAAILDPQHSSRTVFALVVATLLGQTPEARGLQTDSEARYSGMLVFSYLVNAAALIILW